MKDTALTPKVSIVVPIYGVEKYINECVDSILNQTLKEIEVILVDDGSKDRCPQIVDDYASNDPRVVVVHQPNAGYGRAVNHGLEVACGEYVGIIESDDWIEPDMFEVLYNKAKEVNADVVKCDFYSYWSHPYKDKQARLFPEKIFDQTICPREFGDKELFGIQPCVWAGIYKKEFLQKNSITFLETPGASYQDTAFNFKVFISADRFVFVDRAFVHYRQDNETSSVKSTGKIYAVFDEYESVRSFLKAEGMWTSPMIEYYLFVQAKHWDWHLLVRLASAPKSQKIFIKRLRQEMKLLGTEVPDFSEKLQSVAPHPLFICFNEYPRLTQFVFLHLDKHMRLVIGEKYLRMKLFGIRIGKIAR